MSLGRSFLPFSCGNDSFRRFSTLKVISAGRWQMLFSSLLFELEVLINSHIVWIRQSRQDPRLLIMWQTCCCARRLKPKNVSFLLTLSRIPVVYSSWWCEVSHRILPPSVIMLKRDYDFEVQKFLWLHDSSFFHESSFSQSVHCYDIKAISPLATFISSLSTQAWNNCLPSLKLLLSSFILTCLMLSAQWMLWNLLSRVDHEILDLSKDPSFQSVPSFLSSRWMKISNSWCYKFLAISSRRSLKIGVTPSFSFSLWISGQDSYKGVDCNNPCFY